MVDAVGGVAKIVGVALKIKEAANTVHQNKKDCHHIKSRVDILNRTLSHHERNTELVQDSAVMAALEALEGILAEALEVITKCQKPRTIICVYYTAGNLSRQLSKVEQRISYLSSDVMLTIMSYQLLRKFQEGAPHPPPQVRLDFQNYRQNYRLGTHAPRQPPSRPQNVPKFGAWDDNEHTNTGFTVQFDRVKHSRDTYRDECAAGSAGEMTGEPRRFLIRTIAELTRDIKEAVETVLQNKNDCVEIGKRANKVSTLLPQLEDKKGDTKLLDNPAIRGALQKLLMTFRHAHTLVIACQRRGLVPAWLPTPAGQLSIELHEVLDQIALNIAEMTIVLP